MCFSVIRFKRRDIDVTNQDESASVDSGSQYAGMIDQTHENAFVSKLRDDKLVSRIEIYRFHDGETRVERWEKDVHSEAPKPI